MSIEKDRLCSLIEFSQQSVRLRSKPVASVSSYGLPALYEHEIQGLPGIRINSDDLDNEGEIWLVIERLHEIKPPAISNVVLSPWVKMTDVPTEEPSLRETISTTLFAESKNDYSSEMVPGEVNSNTIPKGEISLSDFKDAEQIRSHFATYLITKWQPWAEIESRRRKTIWIYNQLFKIKQQLEGSIVEAQLELVWGLGMGIWNNNGVHVKYPLIGQLVEISLNPVTAELEIRPRDFDANIEIEWYASVKNPGVFSLEKMAKKFFEKTELTFSPFEKGTFEPLLRTAATTLDANGIYWPNEVPAEDRTLPKEDEKLKVTDTWILFARPRNNNLFLHDLEKLKSQIEEVETFPPTVAALVTEPNSNNPVVELPLFRGICTLPSAGEGACYKKAQDLYFPKPFNDEQVRIIQLLAINDGVVVQGPPGTGKTHTIANVICHYLAQGKRVLVTSMKDPALKVLHEQLPAEIRPLAISILTSEQEGMKQFEHAIHKIASEVQGFDRSGTERTIKQLEENIDSLHGKLASIDYTIGEWVKNNIKKIMLEGEEIDPQDASHEVVQNIGQFEWISDPLGIAVEFDPQFSDSDVVSLREARRVLGKDIDYISASLPQLVEFPDAVELVAIHQDQKQLTKLQQCIDNGEVPEIADSSQETLAHANSLLMMIGEVKSLRDAVIHSNYKWPNALREQLRWNNNRNLFESLEELGGELEQVEKTRNKFLECPVVVPPGIEFDEEIEEAINKLSLGKSPFGIKGLFGKSEKKKCLESILVLGDHPNSEKSWKYVLEYLDVRKRLRQLALRWNALAKEIKIDTVSEDKPEGGIAASQAYNIYIKVKQIVIKELEICSGTESIFPNWAYSYDVADNEARMNELEKVLRHYLAKNRLASVWINKERFQKVLDNCNGRVVEDIRQFLSETLGNPAIEDAKVKAEWSGLMAELSRVHSISKSLAVVQEVCNKVEASGAPNYATLLKQPFEGSVDFLLPDNLRKIWRIKRMSSYLHSIDAQDKLRILAKERRQIENGLSHAYLDIVVKRTWLRLAENASASMRSALQAYLNAIQKIGKGTGKRAVRYRQDARIAATKANPIVPCWIMPHYRVSESLPSELGCFDLVVVDEASQSDLTALPALLRAKKVLIVGDDKQVSPDGVGLEEDSIRNLMSRFLSNQVEIYGRQMSPERSIYDLYKVVFAGSTVMLKEHFRCVSPIIEYSKREFYNHELRPLRIPKTSERLDPPLVDVMIESGYRENDINRAEARFIVNEIKEIISDEKMGNRTIGVVSLLGYKQASTINEILIAEIGTEAMQCHQIECGDARTFQGKERSIMFLSMVSAPNNVGAPLSRDTFAQRFNVAASRARDRMYLVRSVEARCLSEADMLRRNLIAHFTAPYIQDEAHVESRRNLCESPFELDMYDELTKRGYWVTPQVKVGGFRIDLVVEGQNDARLAIECDGDRYHGSDKWADDMQRQRILERIGWVFWRCFASAFILHRNDILEDLIKTLAEHGIKPMGADSAPISIHTEHRSVAFSDEQVNQSNLLPIEGIDLKQSSAIDTTQVSSNSKNETVSHIDNPLHRSIDENDSPNYKRALVKSEEQNLPFLEYSSYYGPPWPDPQSVAMNIVTEGIVKIIEVEGPVIAKRVYDIYLRGCDIHRMGHVLKSIMNKALERAINQGLIVFERESYQEEENELTFSIVRKKESPPIRVRTRGPRDFYEIPPSEIQVVAKYLLKKNGFQTGSDEHMRGILEFYDLKRLTTPVGNTMLKIIQRSIPYVDEYMKTFNDE